MDMVEAALVAQAAWATIRAHAGRVRDAGELMSLAAGSLWRMPADGLQTAVALVLLDTVDGTASIAMAGNCLVWRVRAAAFEQLTVQQPLLGGTSDFSYASQFVQLSVRERLLLVADNPIDRPATLALNVAANFSRLDAESHRRMVAADAVAVVRNQYQQTASETVAPSASIIAVRRR
jgi:stage II sporulation SpoE-like protein